MKKLEELRPFVEFYDLNTVSHYPSAVVFEFKGDVQSVRAPVDNLLSNWAYMHRRN
jgi:hypothetical protein